MSTIMPQSALNEQSATMIVIRTVHGDAISVPIDMLNRARIAHLTSDMAKSEAAQAAREAG